MYLQTVRLWAVFGLTVFALTTAQAEGTLKPRKINAPTPAVVVKIGDSLLEEYHGGNPDTRTTITRREETASKTKAAVVGKKRA